MSDEVWREACSPWRPIETAPKGEELLGWVPTFYRGKGGCAVIIWDALDECWYQPAAWQVEPSHWQPLPAGPPHDQAPEVGRATS